MADEMNKNANIKKHTIEVVKSQIGKIKSKQNSQK